MSTVDLLHVIRLRICNKQKKILIYCMLSNFEFITCKKILIYCMFFLQQNLQKKIISSLAKHDHRREVGNKWEGKNASASATKMKVLINSRCTRTFNDNASEQKQKGQRGGGSPRMVLRKKIKATCDGFIQCCHLESDGDCHHFPNSITRGMPNLVSVHACLV